MDQFEKIILSIGILFLSLVIVIGINSEQKARQKISETKIEAVKAIKIPAIASWYDVDHCIGCRADRIMSNGKKLDDDAFTCAFNGVPIGTMLIVQAGNRAVKCEVTDRIGMNRIDLTPAAFEKLAPLEQGLIEVEIIK